MKEVKAAPLCICLCLCRTALESVWSRAADALDHLDLGGSLSGSGATFCEHWHRVLRSAACLLRSGTPRPRCQSRLPYARTESGSPTRGCASIMSWMDVWMGRKAEAEGFGHSRGSLSLRQRATVLPTHPDPQTHRQSCVPRVDITFNFPVVSSACARE